MRLFGKTFLTNNAGAPIEWYVEVEAYGRTFRFTFDHDPEDEEIIAALPAPPRALGTDRVTALLEDEAVSAILGQVTPGERAALEQKLRQFAEGRDGNSASSAR